MMRFCHESRATAFAFAGALAVLSFPAWADFTVERVSPIPVSGGDVAGWAVTPSGSHVVFFGDFLVNDEPDAYAHDVAAGTTVQLSSATPGLQVSTTAYAISPSTQRLVYQEYDPITTRLTVKSVPLGGGASSTLVDSDSGFRPLQLMTLSNDGQLLAGVVSHSPADLSLYTVRVDGTGSITTYPGGYSSAGNITDLAFVQNDAGLIFVYRPDPSTGERLFRLNLSNSSVTPLSPDPATSANFRVRTGSVLCRNNSQYVVWKGGLPSTSISREIWSSDLQTGSFVKISTAAPDGTVTIPNSGTPVHWLSPDGSRVVYAFTDSAGVRYLYSVPSAGGSSTLLTPPNWIGARQLEFTPDSSTVVAHGLQFDSNPLNWLPSAAPAAGPAQVAPIVTPPSGYGVAAGAKLGASGTRLYSLVSSTSGTHQYILSTPLAGGTSNTVEVPSPDDRITDFVVAPGESRILVRASAGAPPRSLYEGEVGGPTPTRVHAAATGGGSGAGGTYLYLPGENTLVFTAALESSEWSGVCVARRMVAGAATAWHAYE